LTFVVDSDMHTPGANLTKLFWHKFTQPRPFY
jgi:hypothetical protein